MRTTSKVLAGFALALSLTAGLLTSPGAAVADTVEEPPADQFLVISEESMLEAQEIASQYTAPAITTDAETGAKTVTFANSAGTQYSYTYGLDDVEQIDPPAYIESPEYKTEWHWWGVKYRLNRGETRELWLEGQQASFLYALGAAAGCGACAIGAAIEGRWSFQASRFYNEGNCIHLNMPYMTSGRTKRGTYNCK